MAVVDVVVLGPVSVLVNGSPTPLTSAKQRLILTHLALAAGRTVSEGLLIDEMWETPPADPVHALQAHVSRLRHATSLPIEHHSGGYRLDTRDVEIDASRFEMLLSAARGEDADAAISTLEEAMTLCRGPALDNVPPTPGVQSHRSRLDLLRNEAVSELVDAYLGAGRPQAALPLLHEAVERNPLDERRWAQLMIALDRDGQRSQALETYARARSELVDLLGLEPSAALQEIQHEILTQTADLDEADPAVLVPPRDVHGREREWAALTRLWREAEQQQRAAVVMGEPGIGKTHLASRFVAALPHSVVRTARCHATIGAPYEPLAQLIRSDCTGLDAAELIERTGSGADALRHLVPDLIDEAPQQAVASSSPLDPQVERHRLHLGLSEWLRRASASRPLCLVIDDLQWADSDTVRLLADLWAHADDLPILWIVTLRDREHLPDSPRSEILSHAIRPSATLEHLTLAGLDKAAVNRLVTSAVNSTDGVPDDTLEEILAATAGNPLFVLETARQLVDDDAGEPLLDAPVPPNLTAIVDDHVARLDDDQRELLDVAAVVGEEFDPAVVGLAADRDAPDLDSFLMRAQHLRLLEPVGRHAVRHRFRHALVQAAVSQQITPLRRAELHLRVAQAVEHHRNTPDRLHVLAHHYARAVSLVGNDEAVAYLVTAADASQRQQAPAVALDLYREAQELLTSESPVDQRCEVHLGLGEAGFRSGADYRGELLTAARLASRTGDIDRLIRAAVANNRGWYSSIADVDRDRVSVIESALSMLADTAVSGHEADRARLLSLWAMENVRDPARRDDVLSHSAESMQIAQEIGQDELLGEIMCHRFSILYATLTDPVSTFEFAQHLDTFAHARVAPELQLKAAIAVAQSAMMVADFTTADRALDRSQQLAIELAHPPRLWLVNTWIATRTALRGDVGTAQTQAAEALELGTSLDEPDAFTWFAGQLFVFHHMTDRLPEIIDAVEEQAAQLTGQIPAWRAAHALTLAAVDRRSEAQAIIDDFCATGFAQLPMDVLYLQGLSYLADATAAIRHDPAAGQLYTALLPYRGLMATNATIDAGPIDLRLGQLAALRSDTEAARDHLAAAEAVCRASGAATWLEHVVKAQALLLS